MLRLYLVLIVFAVVLWFGVKLAFSEGVIAIYPSFAIHSLLLLVFTTAVVCRYLSHVNNPQMFVQLFLLLMVVKLIAFLGYLVFIFLMKRPSAVTDIVFFLVAYLIFTLIEIVFLYRRVHNRS